jgi:hypothetical protein
MKDVHRTSTGVEIGCMYQEPMRQLNPDEERIQRALLDKEGPDSVWSALYKTFLSTFGVNNERT